MIRGIYEGAYLSNPFIFRRARSAKAEAADEETAVAGNTRYGPKLLLLVSQGQYRVSARNADRMRGYGAPREH